MSARSEAPPARPALRAGLPARGFAPRFLRAVRDPGTYDLHRSAGLWIGLVLALPLPILALCCGAPPWVLVLTLAAPVLSAVALGAAARVAHLFGVETERADQEASRAREAHALRCADLEDEVGLARGERERMERLQRASEFDLHLAERVNRSLLPPGISDAHVEVAIRQLPCHFVGGDYLHAELLPEGLLYLCIGDVAGHGVAAALVVSRLHGVVQRLVVEGQAPARFLQELDAAATAILAHTPLFVTFAVVRIDLRDGRMDYATAGHPAPLLVRGAGAVELLGTPNGALGSGLGGLLGLAPAERKVVETGDTLVLFTDGLFEVAGRDGGELLGEGGLADLVGRPGGRTATAMADEALERVTAFGHAGPFADDVSLIVARVGPRWTAGPRAGRPRATTTG